LNRAKALISAQQMIVSLSAIPYSGPSSERCGLDEWTAGGRLSCPDRRHLSVSWDGFAAAWSDRPQEISARANRTGFHERARVRIAAHPTEQLIMRFTLIDKITELKPGESITAVKNLSLAEEYLQDHFPGFPIMPGVLMVEAMVQTGAWLIRATEDFRYSTVLLKEAKAVKFNSFVSPGKTLELTATVHKRDDRIWTLKTAGTVDGVNAVNARLTLGQFNVCERAPQLASADEKQIQSLRELFTVLYPHHSA
jgi:3-hydroxyacyl-[acyl-carrier-protein] dehydratase